MIEYKLKNGKTIELNHLSKEELDDLLKVKTTIRQARQIRRRNLKLFEVFKNRDSLRKQYDREIESGIGCPHCNQWYDCSECAWMVLNTKENPDNRYPCCLTKFGGVTYDDQITVKFGHDFELVRIYNSSSCDEDEEIVKNFLLGHVEWADAMILLKTRDKK